MAVRTKPKRSFASDNNAGVHPRVLEAIAACERRACRCLRRRSFTDGAVKIFREHFGKDVEVYFVFGGTGANVLGLKAVTEPYHAIICAETAHINVDECGAPEKFTGCKLLSLPTEDGKITVEQMRPFLNAVGFEHHVQPRVISVSQSTEMGTVYKPQELKKLSAFAHKNGMLLHMDGARIANAAASLKAKPELHLERRRRGCTFFRGRKERDDVRRSCRLLRPKSGKGFQVHSKARHALTFKNAFYLSAIFSALVE